MKEESLEDKKKKLEYLKQTQTDILKRANKEYNIHKVLLLFALIGFESLFLLLVWLIGWNLIEPISWLVTFLVLQGILVCYLVVFEKSLNLFTILNNKKESILNKIYNQEKFNPNKITDLESIIENERRKEI